MAKKTTASKKATASSSKATKKVAARCTTKAAAKSSKSVKATCKTSGKPAAKAATKTKKRRITFTLHSEPGQQVFVAGSFNNWDPIAKEMVDKQGNGTYKGILCLPPGEYQYKFVVNGTWCVDQANQSWIQNSHGTLNSVIHVE